MTTGDSTANKEFKKEIIETHSAQETFALGQRIGLEALPGQVYTLIGDLGVGKTVFTQGVADGLGITEPVNSPTFIILMCTASEMWRRWKRSVTRTVFTVRDCA